MSQNRAFGERLLRVAMRFHPTPFRRAYGDEMVEYYREMCRHERPSRGRLWQVRFLATSMAAAAREGLRQRRRRLTPEPAVTTPTILGDGPNYRKERRPMIGVATDLRHALRRLTARPMTSALGIGMLALAVGVTTAMFTVVDALLIRPVPFPAAKRLGRVSMRNDRTIYGNVAPGVLRAWRESSVFEAVEGAHEVTIVVEADTAMVVRKSAFATPGLFTMLGARPLVGRLFNETEGRAGTDEGVLLSERFWRSVLGGSPSALGTRLRIDGRSLVVVGILPDTFRFPSWDTELWRPLDYGAPPPALAASRPSAYARFADGVPQQDALGQATTIALAADPAVKDLRASHRPLAGLGSGSYLARATPFLAGGVVLVFLVLCANVSSLLLAQLGGRAREFGMCAALGASRSRLLRQALTEALVLGGCGIATGIGAAWLLVSLTRSWLPDAFLLQTLNPIDLDLRALTAASASGVAATVAAGLLPAWIGTRVNAAGSSHLRTEQRGATESRLARLFTRGLLVSEIGLSCTLLVGTALLVTSFVRLAEVDRGLDTSGVVTGWLTLAPAGKTEPGGAATALEDALRELPGVSRVVLSEGTPPGGGWIHFGDGWVPDTPGATALNLEVESYGVGRDFFDLFRIRLLRGRTFERGEDPNHVIVGERFAELMWPGMDPVGRSFRFDDRRYDVVGLVNEIRHPSLDPMKDLPEFYRSVVPTGGSLRVSLRCNPACPDLAVLRRTLLAMSQVRRLHSVAALEDAYLNELARPRAAAALAVVFAGIAVLAAAGGLFSVLGYAVGRRRREFGIRASLGAKPIELQRLVFSEGVRLAIVGVAIGSLTAWGLSRVLTSVVYEVTPAEPVIWLTVGAVITVTTIIASWIPARRAAGVDPVELLREQ